MLVIETKLNEAVTAEQLANLQKLADYLETLPQNYSCFDMSDYTDFADFPAEATTISCGTAACLVGHGPAAGIAVMSKEETWEHYAKRVFGAYAGRAHNNDVLHWLFSPEWSLSFPKVTPTDISPIEINAANKNLEFRQARCRLLYSLANNLLPRCDAANKEDVLQAYAKQKIKAYPQELIFPDNKQTES